MTRLLIALLFLFQPAAAPKKGGNPEAAKVTNPVASTPDSIAAGKRVYQRLCTKCHGPEGKGDGEMFSVLRHGTSRDMESYAERISETDTWNVINYVKSFRK